ncbi:MAG TPA: M56 family metallopeptidase [Sphingomicrobium sp.]|nr:M56 family metallopeptidase [Sphingomicrobium sp.]
MSALASNLIGASLLVALVLLIRAPVARAFGPRAAFALWLAPALRLVVPPIPDLAADVAPKGSATWMMVVEPVASAMPATAIGWTLPWLAGAFVFLAVHLARHWLFLRRALSEGRPYQAEGIDCDMVITPAVDGPAATGLVHRLILLPADFETRFTPDQQRVALLHECLHHRRGDIWASAAALTAGAALWFNPLTYVALGAFRRDMESACDMSVLATPGACDPRSYGETILRSAARPVPRSLCALTSLDELKGRLKMLNTHQSSLRQIAGLGIALSVTLGGMAFAAPAVADEPGEKTIIEKRVVVGEGDGKREMHMHHGDSPRAMKCPGQMTVVESAPAGSEKKQEKAKIAICSKTGDKTEIASGLEKALARVEKDSEMNAALRADLSAKLRAKIAELRGQ